MSYGDIELGLIFPCRDCIVSFSSAVDGCKYVIHTASPFPMGAPTNADDVIKPAVDGTLTVMKACQKARVSRMVLTSSAVAIFGKFSLTSIGIYFTKLKNMFVFRIMYQLWVDAGCWNPWM